METVRRQLDGLETIALPGNINATRTSTCALFARLAAATPRLSVVWEQVESSGYATG
jgi:hypothetical protein